MIEQGLKFRITKRRSSVGYIEQNLIEGEVVIYKTKLHWFPVFLWPAFILLLFVFGLISDNGEAGAFFLLIALILGLGSLVNYSASEFGVINKRILAKVGWVSRRSLDILLTKVEGIHAEQGILGKILGYGTVVVTGSGGTKSVLKNIAYPLEFRKIVQEP